MDDFWTVMGNALLNEINGQDDPLYHQALEEAMEQRGGGVQSRGRFQFVLEPMMYRRSERMGVRERVYRTYVRQVGAFNTRQNLQQALVQGLQSAMEELLQQNNIPDRDRVYFHLVSSRLQPAYEGWGLTAGEWRQNQDRVAGILENLSRMLNSNQQFEMDDSFNLTFVHVRNSPWGGGQKKHTKRLLPGHMPSKKLKGIKQCVISIPQTEENMCCARAIVTAKACVDQNPKWRAFQRGREIQRWGAIALHNEAHVPFGFCGYDEISRLVLAPSLYNYTIVLVDANRGYHCTAFGQGDKLLGLLYEDGHYDALTSLPGFFGKNYICSSCLLSYDHAGKHACPNNAAIHCGACLQEGCPDHLDAYRARRSATLGCNQCGRQFYGDTCVTAHQQKSHDGKPAGPNKPSVCTSRRKCQICRKLLRGQKEIKQHLCGYTICRSCKEYVDVAEHKCFIQRAPSPQQLKEERKKKNQRGRRGAEAGLQTLRTNDPESALDVDSDTKEKEPLHVFFDIESMQMDASHVPNLVVAETEYDGRPVRFRGEFCIRDFLEWLETLTEEDTRPLTVIAHNFQGYDSYPVIEELHRQKRKIVQVRNGGKVLELRVEITRFIDSLSFFQMPLADFPKTFGLTEQKKGYFPHLFNTPGNQDYVGNIPDKRYYMPENMSVKGRQDFDQWYDQQVAKGLVFDFVKELTEYCESDVKLLKHGCLTFKGDFEKLAHFNPFEQMTIASACNRDLRMNCMEENTIASEPLHGWRMTTKHSKTAMEWLLWQENCLRQTEWLNLTEDEQQQHEKLAKTYPDALNSHHPLFRQRIQHARNQGEHRLVGTRHTVDGYDVETNTAYEFEGCYWHGCRTCYPQRREEHHRLLDRTMDDVRVLVDQKREMLKARGYNVVSIWECEWNALKRTDPNVREFVAKLDLQEQLDPRDAFFGGRTNAIKLYHRADVTQGEEIRYYDYTSLYPWVNKYGKYPVGHPKFIYQPKTTDIAPYFGLIKVTVLPPTDLYHPVLPYRTRDKLTFPLCRACVESNIDQPLHNKTCFCHHEDHQRALTGTWCTPEVEKAIKKGYTILTIHEIWHFAEHRVGLFKDYVNTWLKLKTEASGWPPGCTTIEQRQAYLAAFQAKEGIQLEYEKIKYNPGLRSLAKLMLNSMWGKFGQRSNKIQVKEFIDPQAFTTFLDSDQHDIRYVSPLSEDRVEVHHKMAQNCERLSPNLNIFVAAFTTCWARLRLYEALELLEERVLYFDTDSVLYIHTTDEPDPVVGDNLGDFKNELGAGDYIVEFCSGGPKNYGYQTQCRKTVCKVRGFSLNTEGAAQLNYHVLKGNTLDELLDPLCKARKHRITQTHSIHRDAKRYTLSTQPTHKDYRLVFTKRIVDLNTFKTYPYSYKRVTDQDNLAPEIEV